MATCHQTHTEWMAPRVADRKRVSGIGEHPLRKHMKLCPSASPELHTDIACIMHVTRKRSHELAKLLCPSPRRDRRLIRHQLDPSIFDAEVSDDDDDDGDDDGDDQRPRLLPEVRAELQCLLKPRCLDAGYDEGVELRDPSVDDDSEELPDLDDDDDDDDDDAAAPRAANSKANSSRIIPVLDKLKLLPVVRLTRLEDLHPRVTKKLKLKAGGAERAGSKFVWNREHHSRLRSILFSVGRRLSASRTPRDHPAHAVDHPAHAADHPAHAVDHPAHAAAPPDCPPMNRCVAEILKSCDTEDGDFQLRFLRLCHSCLVGGRAWPVDVLRRLLRLVRDAGRPAVQWGAYDVLSTLLAHQRGAVQLPFAWRHVADAAAAAVRLAADGGAAPRSLLGPALALQYMTAALERDRATAARWLAVDRRYQSASRLAAWLLELARAGDRPARGPPPAPRLAPLVQRLLDLSVAVSAAAVSADVHLDRLATELSQGYVRLKTYAQRHRLVSGIKPSVILFKLCSRLLDNYGCSKMVSLPGGSTVADLLDMYSTCMPLDLRITDEDAGEEHETENKRGAGAVHARYSPTAIEEVAFLTWSLISAHVRLNQGKQLAGTTDVTSCVRKLEAWYRSLTSQLSPKTQLYLKMIECLNPS